MTQETEILLRLKNLETEVAHLHRVVDSLKPYNDDFENMDEESFDEMVYDEIVNI
jgi:hypothetical protein